MPNLFQVNPVLPLTMPEQICQRIRRKILTGELPEGYRFLPLTQIADKSTLSTGTIRRAFDLLAAANLVIRRPRLGTFVHRPRTISSVQEQAQEQAQEQPDLNPPAPTQVTIFGYDSLYKGRMTALLESFEAEVSRHGNTCRWTNLMAPGKTEASISHLGPTNAAFYIPAFGRDPGPDLNQLHARNVATVAFDYDEDDNTSTVRRDFRWAMENIIRYLLELGHKSICLASLDTAGVREQPWAQLREKWFLKICAQKKIPVSRRDILRPPKGLPSIKKMGLALAERQQSTIASHTAVIAVNDELAIGMLTRLPQLGIRIPEDVSLAGFDNDPATIVAGITSVSHCLDECGRQAARLLMNLRQTPVEQRSRHITMVRPRLFLRPSVARCMTGIPKNPRAGQIINSV